MTSSFLPDTAGAAAEQDVGLGTAYERTAVYRRILSWCEPDAIRTAAEGPVDGMAGMPGLHLLALARRGVRVTVAHADPRALERVERVYRQADLEDQLETVVGALPERRFDLVVCFNALALVSDWRAHLAEQWRRAERLIVFVSHPWSYGTWIRRGLRLLERGTSGAELFDHEAARPRVLRSALYELGRIEDETWVDAPWWPDLFVPTGSTLAGSLGSRAEPRFVYDAETFPYARPELPRELERTLARHPEFERSRLAPLFAHHRAYLVVRG